MISKRETLVLKFGGAALADAATLAAAVARVLRRRESGHRICVVVSASGSTTDDLLRTAHDLGVRQDDRECDALLALAECESAALFAMHLRRQGLAARSLSGGQAGIRTDATHGNASVVGVEPTRLVELLARDIVPVVAGFQGVSEDGDTTTLGRGGSDLSAVLIGAALDAEAVELYKDVDGVYDNDPDTHDDAILQREIDHATLRSIVTRGDHPIVQLRAVDAAEAHGVVLRILPTSPRSDHDCGTLVHGDRPRSRPGPVLVPHDGRRRNPPQKSDVEVFESVESAVRSYCRTFPTVFARAKGAHLHDEQGRSYIDFFAGAGALNYGHNPDFIQDRLVAHLRSDAVTHALDMFTTTKRAFLEEFRSVVLEPRGLDYRVQFCGPTGANSVEAALKLARLVTGRVPVASFTGGWHGMTAACLSVTGNRENRAAAGAPLPFTLTLPFPEGPYRMSDALGYVESLFTDPNSGLDLPAALILETIQAEGGIYVAPVEWLRGIRALCDRHGVLLIADEIQVGCGRSGTFFSFERAGIVPDLVCVSKSIGGYGLPMSLLLIKPGLDAWKPGQHTGTFRGNQLAFCAATAALSLWRTPDFERGIAERADIVARFLESEVRPLHPGIEIRGMGMIWGLDLARVGGPALAKRTAQLCFAAGLVIERCGRDDTALKIMPPLTIGKDTLIEGLGILRDATRAALAETIVEPQNSLAEVS